MNQILEYLRSRSPQTKNRIITSTIIIAIIVLSIGWITSVKNNLGGLESEDLLPQNHAEASNTNFITIEAAEDKDDKTIIYFKVTNTSPDILNFSMQDKVGVQAGDKTIPAEKVLDRQDKEFVKKVLSNSTEYGMIIFPKFERKGNGTVYFDDLFFEQDTSNKFLEAKTVNFKNLKPVQELRS